MKIEATQTLNNAPRNKLKLTGMICCFIMFLSACGQEEKERIDNIINNNVNNLQEQPPQSQVSPITEPKSQQPQPTPTPTPQIESTKIPEPEPEPEPEPDSNSNSNSNSQPKLTEETLIQAKALWEEKSCELCHGDTGEWRPNDFTCTKVNCQSITELRSYIDQTMPLINPADCQDSGDLNCALLLAQYIAEGFPDNTSSSEQAAPEPEPEIAYDPSSLSMHISPLRRLTHAEYKNSIDTLLNVNANISIFPGESNFKDHAEIANLAAVGPSLMTGYYNVAQSSINQVADLSEITQCDFPLNDTCIQAFINNFGSRAFRRPLTAYESNNLQDLFRLQQQLSDDETAIKMSLTHFLLSPNFLYLVEEGIPETAKTITISGKTVRTSELTPFELASRLSYLIQDNMPDQTLMNKARNNELKDTQSLLVELNRLINIERNNSDSKSTPVKRLEEWLGLAEADEIVDKTQISRDLAQQKLDRLSAFLGDWFFSNAAFADLFTDSIEIDRSTEDSTAYPFMAVGFLGQPGYLLSHSHQGTPTPITRGVFTIKRILCGELAGVPAIFDGLPPKSAVQTERDWLKAHSSDPACASCHQKIDPYGFMYERFNLLGEFQSMEANQLLTAAADLPAFGDVSGPHQGLEDFANTLANTTAAKNCVAKMWFESAFGREVFADEQAYIDYILSESVVRGNTATSILEVIITSPLFRYRITEL